MKAAHGLAQQLNIRSDSDPDTIFEKALQQFAPKRLSISWDQSIVRSLDGGAILRALRQVKWSELLLQSGVILFLPLGRIACCIKDFAEQLCADSGKGASPAIKWIGAHKRVSKRIVAFDARFSVDDKVPPTACASHPFHRLCRAV